VSEKELGRLRQAVNLLLEVQEEASDAAKRGLEWRKEVFDSGDSSAAAARLEEALVDVLDILEGASTDVRGILENDAEGWVSEDL
jgi:hypothetical protein